jgi:phosphoribosylanthranilate isomerase
MATRIKICGITRAADAEQALELGADYLGIIVYEKSPRAVPMARIPELLEVIPRGRRVLVDVAPDNERLRRFADCGFDACQIHFDLDAPMAAVAGWSDLVGPDALWLAPRIAPEVIDFPQILMGFADTLLLDAFDRSAYGGTGQAGRNWQRFLDCTVLFQHKRWILAGGLSPDNIGAALAFTEAEWIDVNSGVERAPGVKDPAKLAALFGRVREFDARRG